MKFTRAGSLGDSTLREQRHRTLSPVGRKEQYHGINSLPFGVACQRHETQVSLRKSNSVCFLLALRNSLIPTGAKLRVVFSSRRAHIFLLFRCPKGPENTNYTPQSYANLSFHPEGPRKKSVHRRLPLAFLPKGKGQKPNSRFHIDSLPPFLFFGPSGRKASEPHPFGAKIKFSLLSP